MPNDPDSTKTKVVLGVFYRFPYEFNAGWSLVPETINESGRSASGIIDLGDLRKDATQLAEVLRKGFDFPLWPGAIGDSDAEWLKDIIFEAGCRKIDKEDKLIDALSHRSPNDRED